MWVSLQKTFWYTIKVPKSENIKAVAGKIRNFFKSIQQAYQIWLPNEYWECSKTKESDNDQAGSDDAMNATMVEKVSLVNTSRS